MDLFTRWIYPDVDNLYPREPDAKFYKDKNKGGQYWTVSKSRSDDNPHYDDSLSSLELPPHMRVRIYENKNYSGKNADFYGWKTYPGTNTPGYIPDMKKY